MEPPNGGFPPLRTRATEQVTAPLRRAASAGTDWPVPMLTASHSVDITDPQCRVLAKVSDAVGPGHVVPRPPARAGFHVFLIRVGTKCKMPAAGRGCAGGPVGAGHAGLLPGRGLKAADEAGLGWLAAARQPFARRHPRYNGDRQHDSERGRSLQSTAFGLRGRALQPISVASPGGLPAGILPTRENFSEIRPWIKATTESRASSS